MPSTTYNPRQRVQSALHDHMTNHLHQRLTERGESDDLHACLMNEWVAQPIRRAWYNHWHLGCLTRHGLPYIDPHAYLRLAQKVQQEPGQDGTGQNGPGTVRAGENQPEATCTGGGDKTGDGKTDGPGALHTAGRGTRHDGHD